MKKWQEQFRLEVKEFVDYQKSWLSDYINYRVSFKDDDKFHLDIIEDCCSHIHVHGVYDDGFFHIKKFSSQATVDLTNEVLNFIKELEL